MNTPLDNLFLAASFAARAHRGQVRKDGQTPYAAHPFRVCLVARMVFSIDDPEILTAALLHDTIEDTTTDYDDIVEQFGERVAGWVRALTKDKRLADIEREADYVRQLIAGGWQVHVLKLADMYDNLSDVGTMDAAKRAKTLARVRFYLDHLRPGLAPEAKAAFAIVESSLR